MQGKNKVTRYFITEENSDNIMPNVMWAIQSILPSPVKVTVQQQKETRGDTQNRLMWVWIGHIAKQQGYKPDELFSIFKLDYLLPIKLSHDETHDRAAYEQEIITATAAYMGLRNRDTTEREYQVKLAYDLIRSKNIPVRIFAEWVQAIEEYASEAGIILPALDEPV